MRPEIRSKARVVFILAVFSRLSGTAWSLLLSNVRLTSRMGGEAQTSPFMPPWLLGNKGGSCFESGPSPEATEFIDDTSESDF